jgi:hypothetical protein
MAPELLRKIPAFILNPVTGFRGVSGEPAPRALAYFGLLFLLYLILSYIAFALRTLSLPIGPPDDLLVLFLPHAMLRALTVVYLPIYVALLHGLVYALGGRRGFLQTLKPVLYGLTPLLLLGYIEPLFLIAGLWSVGLIALGVRELQGLSIWRALTAVIIPSLLLVLSILLLFFALVL